MADVTAAIAIDRPEQLPAVLIFPVVDSDNKVRADGYSLAVMAMFSATYGPERRMGTSVGFVQEVLGETGCWQPDRVLDTELIEICRSACGDPAFAISTLTQRRADYALQVRIFDNSGGHKQYDRSFRLEEYGQIPGQIARIFLEHVGSKLTADQLELLGRSQVQSEEEVAELTSWPREPSNELDAHIREYLTRNADCLLVWEAYISRAYDATAAILHLDSQQPPVPCDRLQISAAVRLRQMGQASQAISRLLPLVPTHSDDTYFWNTFVRCAVAMQDVPLAEQLLSEWRSSGTRYADHLHRGRFLIDWAWDARGGGFAHEVAPEAWEVFHQRLQDARTELETSVNINPQGWSAHARLISVAMGLGLPRTDMERHFQQTIQIVPTYTFAYEAKLSYLKPRWHGTPDELVAFGRECLDTGLWECGIPPLCIEAIDDAFSPVQSQTFDAAAFQSEELWHLVKRYREAAAEHGTAAQQRFATSFYARSSVLAGKYSDVEHLFSELAFDYDGKLYDETVFPDLVNFLQLFDRIKANTGDNRLFPHIRLALAEGRLDKITGMLDGAKPNTFSDSRGVQHYRRVLQLARQLADGGDLQLEPRHLRHAFDAVSGRMITNNDSGEIRDDVYVWKMGKGAYAPNEIQLVFPASFRRATIQGAIYWSPGINFVEIAWRQRTNQAPVYLRCYPESSQMSLVEDGWTRHETALATEHLDFAIVIGDSEDTVKVNGETEWNVFTEPPEPGTFSIRAMANVEHRDSASFTIRELYIKH
ncbi:MAG TPA: hypothetical protein VMM76_06105 [Pirellulaceae bacterium]|nr:hypothetical protein [Pirellulaceae bacterium]